MSVIHYKFKSALEYDTLNFDGFNISVADLKKAIIEQKKLGKNGQFHLSITDAQTKQAYVSDSDLIPRNASVIISRVPIGGAPKKTSKLIEDALNAKSSAPKLVRIHLEGLLQSANRWLSKIKSRVLKSSYQ